MPNSASLIILQGSWCIALTLLILFYNSILMTFMVTTDYTTVPMDFEELLASDYEISMQEGLPRLLQVTFLVIWLMAYLH